MKIGILALQGDYEKHARILESLEIESALIRYPQELEDVDGLIIPGGESTTLTQLMRKNNFYQTIKEFANDNPVLGTCAGLIMMANKVEHALVKPLGLMDIAVDRNAYGRQVHSFVDELPVRLNGQEEIIPATFIRAPRISNMGKDVEILAEYNNAPCAVKQDQHIALAFHPELNGINIFHKLAFCINEAIEHKKSFHAA